MLIYFLLYLPSILQYQSSSLATHLGVGVLAGIVCLLSWVLAHRDLVQLGWRYSRRIKID